MRILRDFGRTFHIIWIIHRVIFVWILQQMVSGLSSAQCLSNMCPHPEQTLREMPDIEQSLVQDCYKGDTEIVILCNRGFRSTGNDYITTCNAETGEFEADESCRIDILTLIIAIALMVVVLFTFPLVTFLVWSRYTKRRKKTMYDTSLDVSEVIDGHREDGDQSVVNIANSNLSPSPRTISIEEENEVGNQAEVEVHCATSSAKASDDMPHTSTSAAANRETLYANSAAYSDSTEVVEDDIQTGMVPSDPQAGNSRDKLIEIEREEPDGEVNILNPYGNIERPLKRNRRGSSGGSAKVLPVTSPLVFEDRSASIRSYDTDIDVLYAKINKVKRASERWPPGGKDATSRTKQLGRRADLDDLLDHINNTTKKRFPTKSAASAGSSVNPAENVYADVDKTNRNRPGALIKSNAPPTAPKPARTKTVKFSDMSTPSTNISSNFNPPSPPPTDGVEGMYAEIDLRPITTNQDPETGIQQFNPLVSGDGVFTDHPTTEL